MPYLRPTCIEGTKGKQHSSFAWSLKRHVNVTDTLVWAQRVHTNAHAYVLKVASLKKQEKTFKRLQSVNVILIYTCG